MLILVGYRRFTDSDKVVLGHSACAEHSPFHPTHALRDRTGERARGTSARVSLPLQRPFFHTLFFCTFLACQRGAKAVWDPRDSGLASTFTRVVPSFFRPILWAAARERSM